MARVGQLGVVIGLLGLVITLIGLFPGLIAFPPTPGLGVMQILVVNFGFSVLIFGAMIYVKFIFYAESRLTLAQKIGIRLSFNRLGDDGGDFVGGCFELRLTLTLAE